MTSDCMDDRQGEAMKPSPSPAETSGNNMDNFTDDASPKAGVPTGSGAVEVDPRDPDYSREGRQGRGTFFCYHNCYRCKDGQLPCFTKLGVCEYPHARND